MFLSKEHLVQNFGLDPEIAVFFVNRKVPENNMYWKGKLLYMRHNPGYLFIPIMADVLYRMGVSKEQLLQDPFLKVFEAVLDSAAKEEFGLHAETAHIQYCYELARSTRKEQSPWLLMMEAHFVKRENALPHQPAAVALQRADAFLLALSVLDIPAGKENELLKYWFALISFFLIMDDVDDYNKDKKDADLNILLEWGDGEKAVARVSALLQQNILDLEEINPRLARYCRELMEKFEINERLASIASA